MSKEKNNAAAGGSASSRKLHNEIVKKIVALKRRPQTIPLILLCLTCIVYTFNLTFHSNAAIYVSNQIIALYVFIITLFAMLSVVSYLNAYPKGKTNVVMLGVCLLMLAVQIGLDITCYNIYINEVTVLGTPMTVDVAKAINNTVAHLVFLGISTLAVVLLPVYHKLLLKIPTQVDDEESDNMEDTDEIKSEDDDDLDDDLD